MKRFLLFPLALTLAWAPAVGGADERVPEGFTPLFNGNDLAGWQVSPGADRKAWAVEHGVLFVRSARGGWLMTEKEYGDFEVRLEYRLTTDDGNSGVAIRSPLTARASWEGMEIQILNDPWYLNPKNYKGLQRVQLTGAVYGVVPPSKEAIRPVGEWNKMDISARGPHVTVKVNGTTVVDANLNDYKSHAKEHPGILRKKGHIGLQGHTGRVDFRYIYVKDLTK